ncbi:S-adenosyl-L-methionine-dependent methyltransferase [Obba rivulosa]|uniref:S-adenosyl-L-methionine-dependent methyltransferase n=1 Tax=Obba rivulosa TaxID=1052685 RepID=A0A8E2J5C6_9APHY|nr:S-adenosyl-L-methionine-dependent methyltransferase [Obba rivulosa]
MAQDAQSSDTLSEPRSSSPTPLLYSYHSSLDEQLLLRNAYGRILNNQNDTYLLPADNEEHRRLDLQHHLITLSLGGLYAAKDLVHRALWPRTDRTPSILDVGTGSGSWAVDMAIEFPYCDVVGVDLVPPRITGKLPPNCRFEIDDANLGFVHYKDAFDVVHARSISAGIRDYPQFLRELALVLRPGGVLLVGDGEMQLYDEDRQPLSYNPNSPGCSWTQKVFFSAYNAMKNRGGNIDSPSMSPQWLRAIDGLTDVGWHKIFIPIGPWRQFDAREATISELLRADCLKYISGLAPLLLSEGYLPESVDTLIREATTELRDLSVKLYSRWCFAWAVKK